jgi:hypothetical protein
MDSDSITFSCSACGISLTVPLRLAGVSGPCPTCQALIQAPFPAATATISDPIVASSGSPKPALDVVSPLPEIAVKSVADTPVRAALRPAPRQLPSRHPSQGDLASKSMAELSEASPGPNRATEWTADLPPKNRRARFLMAFAFIVAALTIIGATLNFLARKQTKRRPEVALKSEPVTEATLPTSKAPSEQNKPPAIAKKPTLMPEKPALSQTQPSSPEGAEPVMPGKAANEVLDKFLAAKTLAERLPWIETKTPLAELETSCLAGPLPPTISVLNDGQETNAIERVTDIYFNVDFKTDRQPLNAQTILVRIRGTASPKIVVEPFLDSFGGRLAAYAKTPSDKPAIFQVIVSAIASCNDERVPNREKKLTLKLLARDNTKEIARCYFGRQSKIGAMLEDGTYSISYGKAKACTARLRWNMEDNPATPYLEAIDLNPLDWNP